MRSGRPHMVHCSPLEGAGVAARESKVPSRPTPETPRHPMSRARVRRADFGQYLAIARVPHQTNACIPEPATVSWRNCCDVSWPRRQSGA